MTNGNGSGTTPWTDLAMRSNTTTTEGQVPIDTTGGLSNCPDIIPCTGPINDPQTTFSSSTSWSTDYPGQVDLGSPNYIYVRAKNFAPGAESGTISLYAVGAAVINMPSTWLPNPLTVQSTGATSVEVSATTNQQIVVGSEPFYWAAPPPPPGSDHYCLIALVDTKTTPNPLLHSDVPNTYNTMADLLTNELYAGWKNVAELSVDVPTWTVPMLQEIPPGAGKPGDKLLFSVMVTPGMVGGSVAFSSGDSQGFNPPINMQQTQITSSSFTPGVSTTPSTTGASTILNVSFWKGNSNPGFSDGISTIAGWLPASTEELQPYIDRGVARSVPEHLADELGGGFFVPIGAMHMMYTQAATERAAAARNGG